MESTTSGHRAIAGRHRNPGMTAESKDKPFAKPGRRSRAVERSSGAADYAAFAEEVYRELDPRGALERLVAGHVVQSAWKFKANLEKQAARDRSNLSDPDDAAPKARIRPTELDRAARSMRESLDSLDALRARAKPRPAFPILDREFETDLLSNEWPIIPRDDSDDLPAPAEASSEVEPTTWRDRLVFDFDISETSPIVKGTWVTVGHVVSLIVDGWTWADILRSHPELTEEDIRTCIAYAMAEEGSAA